MGIRPYMLLKFRNYELFPRATDHKPSFFFECTLHTAQIPFLHPQLQAQSHALRIILSNFYRLFVNKKSM